jgi:hypothetical protein
MFEPSHRYVSTLRSVRERLQCWVRGELKDAARSEAAERGQSLTTFVERALEAALPAAESGTGNARERAGGAASSVRLVSGDGA